ncbi:MULTISPECIES: hypothetical protein [unclassified Microcoleus]|uniref:hypothetical protein n=2 Tax=Microcoleus TaxID=44471 RepID=UPI0025DA13C2|nr:MULTISPECIES: hypothetical protein [unclassified Microcoleus]
MINLAKINKKYCGSEEAVFMWEAIAACASVFMAWLSWEEHKRKKEEHEAKYRRGEMESRSFTFPEIAPSQPAQKSTFFLFREVDGCICGIAFWILWFCLLSMVFFAVFGNTNQEFVVIFFILGIPLGRYVQKKVHPWLK